MTKLLSIKYPYSKVMYLCYYKNMRDSEIREKFFMSKSSYYRVKNIGLDMITKMYYPGNSERDNKK